MLADTRGSYSQFELAAEPRPPRDKPSSALKWRAPIFISVSLASAVGLAVGHHCMGSSLSGKPVDDVPVSQAWIFRLNAALAFLVKTALTIGVGTAYVQQQWLRFRNETFRLRDVDALTSVLGNAFSFFGSAIWFGNLKLALVALVSWTMAIITVIAPGFLTVQPVPITNTTSFQVPQPHFNMTNYGTRQIAGGGSQISGDPRIYRLAYHAGVSGQPVPLESTFPNETYHMYFQGPAIKCTSANDSLVNDLTFSHGNVVSGPGGSADTTEFISWAAGNGLSRVMGNQRTDTLDMTSTDAARLFVMTNTGYWGKTRNRTSNGITFRYRQVNVTECLLYNATYSVKFVFEYPGQRRELQITDWLNPVATITQLTKPNPETEPAVVSYTAIMDALGKMLVGNSIRSHYDTKIAYLTSSKMLNIDWSSGEAVVTGLEQLFQNITLSLLSDEGLIRNSTVANFIPVNVTSWPNTYVYNKTDLFITYGLVLFSALGCSTIGLYAFSANRSSSYQNMFSTFLRATNDLDLRGQIGLDDAGTDPLPKRLANAEVEFHHRI